MEWKKAHKFCWFFFLFWVHDAERKLHHICAPNISVGWEICQSSPSQYAATHISANPSGGARVVCGTCHSLFWSHQLSDGSILAHCRSLHATLGYFHVCVSNKSCSPGSSFLHSHDIVLLGFILHSSNLYIYDHHHQSLFPLCKDHFDTFDESVILSLNS